MSGSSSEAGWSDARSGRGRPATSGPPLLEALANHHNLTPGYRNIKTSGVLIIAWAEGVHADDNAIAQRQDVAQRAADLERPIRYQLSPRTIHPAEAHLSYATPPLHGRPQRTSICTDLAPCSLSRSPG